MGRVVEKRVFNHRVVFHFNDLLWPQNSCLIKSKRNWTPFFSSKKRKITQKLPNTQTANFLYKKSSAPKKQQTMLTPHPTRWGCSWWRWSFCSVVFPRPSTLWITAWWTSMASGEAQETGWSGKVETLKPGANFQGSRGRGYMGASVPIC